MAQARSFIRLGLYDRAWGRLRALQGGADPQIAILTGQMFIARGWNNKARKALEKALEAHPENRVLQELFDQASEPPTEPDITDADPGDTPAAIAAARHYMAVSSLVKARQILEQLRKSRPENALVSTMLWALDGDFSLNDGAFADLAQRFGSGLQSLADFPDESEHTETAHIDDVLPPDDSGAFPTLFRNMEPRTEFYGGMADGDDEVTHISAMADLDEMRSAPPPGAHDTDLDLMPAAEVTEIQMVVRKDGAIEDTTSGAGSSVFDLTTLPPFHVSDLDLGPEQEDADLIVRTRREDDVTEDATITQVGMVQLDVDEPAASRQLHDEAATWATPQKKEPEPEVKTADTPKPVTRKKRRPRPARKSNWPWWIAAMVGVVTFSGIIIAALIALPFLASLL